MNFRLPLVLAGLCSAFTLSAAPLIEYAGGSTTIVIPRSATDALAQVGVAVIGVDTNATTTSAAQATTFSAFGSVYDLNTSRGEILHKGALILVAGSTRVSISNLVIDTISVPFEVTGLVTVNGSVVGRLPLFVLSPRFTRSSANQLTLTLPAALTFTGAAAQALNSAFGVDFFREGVELGEAQSRLGAGTVLP